MKITRRADALRDLDPLDAAHFTGRAGSHALLLASAPLPRRPRRLFGSKLACEITGMPTRVAS